jgi:outer membrane autotransporter protein
VGNQNINTGNDAGGAITTTAANTANIVFSGTSAVTGFVGATGTTFLNIAAGANANTVTFAGPVYATTFSVSGAGTVNFNGGFTSNTGSTLDFAGNGFIVVGPGQTVKAAVTNSAGANTGTLTLSGNSILNGAVGAASGLKEIKVVGGNALITGQAKAGIFTLGTNTLNVAGALSTPVAGVINTTIFSTTSYGKIVPVGAATIGNALQVNVTVTGPIANGTSFNIVDATSGTSGSTVIATNNTSRYLFSAAPTTNGLVRITTTQIPLADVIAPVVNPTVPPVAGTPIVNPVTPVVIAPVIDALPVTSGTTPVLTAITLLPSAPAIAVALAQLAPGTANFAAPQVSYRVTQRFQDLWAAHLEKTQGTCAEAGEYSDRVRRNDDPTACHPRDERAQVWASAFGYFGEQSNVRGFEGYDSHILGAMVAYDAPVTDATRAGVGVRYARSQVVPNDSEGQVRINSYQATAYVGYAPGAWFANAALVAGWDKYKGSRHVLFTGVDSVPLADYSGHQYSAYGTTGYHMYVGDGRTVITPAATVQYTKLHIGAYTETGGGDGINLKVNAQNYDLVQTGLGVKAAREIQLSDAQTMRPEIHANWLHSLGGETMKNTAAFAVGGPAFTAVGLKPKRDTFNAGVGVVFANTGVWSVEGVYDYQWKNDSYSAQQAMIKLVFRI